MEAPSRAQNLKDAFLDYAQLQQSSFEDANLQGASLRNANLQEAHLERAALLGASLDAAQLQDAFLNDALLKGASLSRAKLQGAELFDVNRRERLSMPLHFRELGYFIQTFKALHSFAPVCKVRYLKRCISKGHFFRFWTSRRSFSGRGPSATLLTGFSSFAIAAWRLTMNSQSSAGARVQLCGLQAGVG